MNRHHASTYVAIGAIALVAVLGATLNLHLLTPRTSRTSLVGPAFSSSTATPADTTTTDSDRTDGTTTTAVETSTSTLPPSTSVPTPSVPTTATSTLPPTTAPAPPGVPRTYVVGPAGSVRLSVQGAVISVEFITTASGWTYETVRQSSDEVEIDFRRENLEGEASFHATLENSQLQVEIEAPPPDD